jgi:hypothetical protein
MSKVFIFLWHILHILVELFYSQRFANSHFFKYEFHKNWLKWLNCHSSENIAARVHILKTQSQMLGWFSKFCQYLFCRIFSSIVKYVSSKSLLRRFYWYSLENTFICFHFLKYYVENIGWIGWFAKIHPNPFFLTTSTFW